jgi:hypothetical protein
MAIRIPPGLPVFHRLLHLVYQRIEQPGIDDAQVTHLPQVNDRLRSVVLGKRSAGPVMDLLDQCRNATGHHLGGIASLNSSY